MESEINGVFCIHEMRLQYSQNILHIPCVYVDSKELTLTLLYRWLNSTQ